MVTTFFVVVGVGFCVVGSAFGAAGGKYVGFGFSATGAFLTAGVGLERKRIKENTFVDIA